MVRLSDLFDGSLRRKRKRKSGQLITFNNGYSFRVAREVEGGMGVVKIGTFETAEPGSPQIALKTLHSQFLLDARARQLFANEISVWAQIGDSAFVLPLMDIWHSEGIPYAVTLAVEPMEDGCVSLRDQIINFPEGLEVAAVLEAGLCIALGMKSATGKVPNLVHADIKPENVLFYQGVPHLTDFGLARVATALQGGISGSAAYLAPECWSEPSWHPSRDIYAFGCMLYEMLCGEPPFRDGDQKSLADQHKHEAPRPPKTRHRNAVELHDELCRLVFECLHKNPKKRPADFGEIANTLMSIAEEHFPGRFERYWTLCEYDPVSDILDRTTLSARASGLLESGDPVAALQLLEEVPLEQKSIDLLLLTGSALSLKGDDEKALEIFDRCLASQPSTGQRERCLNELALSLRRLGRFEKAIEIFESLLDAETPVLQAGAEANLAATLLDMGDPKKADFRIRRLVRANQNNPRLWAVQGQVQMALGNPEQAISSFERSLVLDPHIIEARLELTDAIIKYSGDFESAFAQLDLAFDLGTHTPGLIARMIGLSIVLKKDDVRAGLLHGLQDAPEDVTRAILKTVELLLDTWQQDLKGLAQDQNTHLEESAESTTKDIGPSKVLETAIIIEGESQNEEAIMGARVYMNEQTYAVDFFYDLNEQDYPQKFAKGLHDLKTKVLPTIADVDLRTSPFRFVECENCGAEVLSNRLENELLLCRRCEHKGTVTPQFEETNNRIVTACEAAAGLDLLDLKGRTLVFALWPETLQKYEQAQQFLTEHNFEPYTPGSAIFNMMGVLARQNGLNPKRDRTLVFRLVLSETTPAYSGTPWPIQTALGHLRRETGHFRSLSMTLEEAEAMLAEDSTLEAVAESVILDHGDRPTDLEALAALIKIRTNQNDMAEAELLVAFSNQLSDTKNASLQQARGEYHLKAGNPSEAIEHLEQAKASDPLDVVVRHSLILALEQSGKKERAKEELLDAKALGLRISY